MTDSSLPDDEYKILVQKTNSILTSLEGNQDWTEVGNLLSRIDLNTIGDEKRKDVIGAIGRLWERSKGERVGKYEEDPLVEDEDRQKVQREGYSLQSPTRPQSPSVEQKIEAYLKESRIFECFVGKEREGVRHAMEEGVKEWVKQNKGQWPGRDALGVKEQFFWNVLYRPSSIYWINLEKVKSLFATTTPLNWKNFITFSEPYFARWLNFQQNQMVELFSIYQAFPEANEARARFISFCEYFLEGVEPKDKPSRMEVLLPIYQAFPEANEARAQFISFCEHFLEGVEPKDKPSCMKALLSIYQAFPEANEERARFISFCEYFLEGVEPKDKPFRMEALLSIYQAFPEANEARAQFISFCEHFLEGVEPKDKPSRMEVLLPIYQAFPEANEARARFISFCNPYLRGVEPKYKPFRMEALLSIYQAFPEDNEAIERFIDFYKHFLEGVNPDQLPCRMIELLPIYQAFPEDNKARAQFIDFCKPYRLQYLHPPNRQYRMMDLLSIYQAFPEANEERARFISFCEHFLEGVEPENKPDAMRVLLSIYQTDFLRENFHLYMQPHLNLHLSREFLKIISTYLSRTYLRYERALAALGAETTPDPVRVQVFYTRHLDDILPPVRIADPFLRQAIAERGVANAHDFDSLYELDRNGLFGWCDAQGYINKPSTSTYTLYNNTTMIEGYRTNSEVEDFIKYLDELSRRADPFKLDSKIIAAPEVVSILKQMLGLKPKKITTSGGFAPYLGHSMYYAKPDSPKGDEMLGQVWFMMKKLAQGKLNETADKGYAETERALKEVEDYKMAMILAMLEASEISETNVDTHCQTRMTGELMKLISWHLPGSKLRPLIAGTDLPPAQTNEDMKMRITAAPERAQELFNRLKREDSGAIRALLETNPEPELWERYQAYYDDLYRRTRINNEDGSFKEFKKDEHILTRDNHGNLVSLYNADGTLRTNAEGQPAPLIVFYQAEFLKLEKTFAELMRRQFEEQRGLIY